MSFSIGSPLINLQLLRNCRNLSVSIAFSSPGFLPNIDKLALITAGWYTGLGGTDTNLTGVKTRLPLFGLGTIEMAQAFVYDKTGDFVDSCCNFLPKKDTSLRLFLFFLEGLMYELNLPIFQTSQTQGNVMS